VLQLTLMLVSAITDALLSLTKFLYKFLVGAVGVGLGDILKPELILPLIENLPIEQLASHLPEGSWTPADILELLQSPPLRQQLDAFTHVLRTGQIDLAQFGVDPNKYKFTVVSFLEALEDSVDKAGSSSSAGDKDAEPKQGGGNDPMDES